MERENLLGKVETYIKVSSATIEYKVMVKWNLKMGNNMKGIGFRTKCMGGDDYHGLMEGNMTVNLLMTGDKVMEGLYGMMEEYIKVISNRVFSMVKVNT